MKGLIVGLLLLSMVGTASAGQLHTCGAWQEMSQEWRNHVRLLHHDSWKSGLYMGYLRAFVDFHSHKLPEGFTYRQALQIFANWLDDNPELWNMNIVMCFHIAFDNLLRR